MKLFWIILRALTSCFCRLVTRSLNNSIWLRFHFLASTPFSASVICLAHSMRRSMISLAHFKRERSKSRLNASISASSIHFLTSRLSKTDATNVESRLRVSQMYSFDFQIRERWATSACFWSIIRELYIYGAVCQPWLSNIPYWYRTSIGLDLLPHASYFL